MIKQSGLARAVASTVFDFITFGKGVDLVTPSNKTVPGSLRDCRNYEIDINGGYTGTQGYERFDGNDAPSDALYYRLDFTYVVGKTIAAGDTITDTTTSATGVVVAVNTTYDAAQPFLVFTKLLTSTFGDTNSIQVGGDTKATADGNQVAGGAPTSDLDAQYVNLAADEYRGDISAITGDQDILGVWVLDDIVYAFRNVAGNGSAKMWKSSSSGWVEVALGFEMAFTSGLGPGSSVAGIEVGDTITGLTSLETAVVTGVVLGSSTADKDWNGGTAAGFIYVLTKSGTFTAAEGLSITGAGGTDLGTVTADAAAITLGPGGRYEFVNFNFGGQSGTKKMYGVDRVNKGFEFDGTNFIRITTGMTVDTPNHVVIHKNHLFYAYDGSAQHSGINTPYNWSPIFGAAEIAVGDPITGFSVQPGSESKATLAIMSRNRIHMLYGSNSGTAGDGWDVVQYRKEVGAIAHSIQEFGDTLMMDDRGIISLKTVQAHGNFAHSLISKLVQPFINSRKLLVTASCIAREKSQYRIFFSDSFALYITTDNDGILGIMIELFVDKVSCICSLEANNGAETIYFGSDNGMVYQLDRGTSFDGASIDRLLNLHFHHAKSPRVEKSYFDASFEVSGNGFSGFTFRYELGYNQSTIPQPITQDVTVAFSSAVWDSMTWDDFIWDGSVLSPSNIGLDGSGENISLIFSSDSDYYEPLTFSGAQLRQTQRKQLRS